MAPGASEQKHGRNPMRGWDLWEGTRTEDVLYWDQLQEPF